MLNLVRVLLLHPRIVGGMLAVAILAPVLIRVIGHPQYRAESVFTPESQRGELSQVAGIAAQFGLTLGNMGSADPVKFHAELVTSYGILRDAVTTRYRFAAGPERRDTVDGTLLDLYQVRGRDEEDRIRRAIGRLRGAITVNLDREAGLVSVKTVARWPALAEAINRRLLDLVAEYNVERRQSQWRAERQFVEGRLAAARQELEQAEATFAAFLERNRRYQDDPRLVVEQSRLLRGVTLAQQVVVSLTDAYEQARISEVRNTPVITVVDRPEGTVRRTGSLVLDALVWIVVGAILAAGLALTAELVGYYRRTYPEVVAELQGLARRAVGQLRPRGRASP